MKRIDNTEDAINSFVENAKEHAISLEYLNNENVGVRGDTAYALLKFYPEECEKVLSEIAVGGYGFNNFNSEMVLSEWKKGTLGFPFMNMKGL